MLGKGFWFSRLMSQHALTPQSKRFHPPLFSQPVSSLRCQSEYSKGEQGIPEFFVFFFLPSFFPPPLDSLKSSLQMGPCCAISSGKSTTGGIWREAHCTGRRPHWELNQQKAAEVSTWQSLHMGLCATHPMPLSLCICLCFSELQCAAFSAQIDCIILWSKSKNFMHFLGVNIVF